MGTTGEIFYRTRDGSEVSLEPLARNIKLERSDYIPEGHRSDAYPADAHFQAYLHGNDRYFGVNSEERGDWPAVLFVMLRLLGDVRVEKVWYGAEQGACSPEFTAADAVHLTKHWLAWRKVARKVAEDWMRFLQEQPGVGLLPAYNERYGGGAAGALAAASSMNMAELRRTMQDLELARKRDLAAEAGRQLDSKRVPKEGRMLEGGTP